MLTKNIHNYASLRCYNCYQSATLSYKPLQLTYTIIVYYRCVRSYIECYKEIFETVYNCSDVISRTVQLAGNRYGVICP